MNNMFHNQIIWHRVLGEKHICGIMRENPGGPRPPCSPLPTPMTTIASQFYQIISRKYFDTLQEFTNSLDLSPTMFTRNSY